VSIGGYTFGMVQMAKRNILTISEAAAEIGVSRQRMHVLCDKYAAKIERVNPRLSLISRAELQKIRAKRASEKESRNN